MRITLWSKDTFIIQWKDQPPPNEIVQNPVIITEQVEVIRGGAKKYIIDFDYSDFGSTKLIGSIPANSSIINTVIEVIEVFDSGTVTVGTQSAQGILMTVNQSNLMIENIYQRINFLETESSQTYKLFFSGSPTEGVGKLTIFYIE